MLCPRCHHDLGESSAECPACGVIIDRYRPRPVPARQPEPEEAAPAWPARALAWLGERMFAIEPVPDRLAVGLRAAVLAGLAIWWLRLLPVPYEGEELMGSLLHWIHLPFHEAGHFLFQPFGTFLHILGGTLGQLLVPLLVAAAFLKEGNPFGASVGVWWLGESFMDCAPYIGDARSRTLMLLSGETGLEDFEGHDWYQLLSRSHALRHDHQLARAFWGVGVALMLAALVWGGYILWRQTRPLPAEQTR